MAASCSSDSVFLKTHPLAVFIAESGYREHYYRNHRANTVYEAKSSGYRFW
jgi:hypothetical protein